MTLPFIHVWSPEPVLYTPEPVARGQGAGCSAVEKENAYFGEQKRTAMK